jgi:hypothetical protein
VGGDDVSLDVAEEEGVLLRVSIRARMQLNAKDQPGRPKLPSQRGSRVSLSRDVLQMGSAAIKRLLT